MAPMTRLTGTTKLQFDFIVSDRVRGLLDEATAFLNTLPQKPASGAEAARWRRRRTRSPARSWTSASLTEPDRLDQRPAAGGLQGIVMAAAWSALTMRSSTKCRRST